MMQTAAEWKKDEMNVNAGQGRCSKAELRIVGNSKKLVDCSTQLHEATTKLKIFIVLLPTTLALSQKYTWSFQELLKGIK